MRLFVDAFCENIAFTNQQVRQVFEQGSDGLEASLLRIQEIRTAHTQLAEEALSFLSLLVVGEGGGGDHSGEDGSGTSVPTSHCAHT